MANREYEVALSFAGEQRAYVQEVAAGLQAAGVRYFFDERSVADMWGEDLVGYLDRVYRRDSRFAVVFVSVAYAAKVWPRAELRSALARAVEEKGAYILPVRFDDTDLPGLLPTVGDLNARHLEAGDIVRALLQKLGRASAQAQRPAPGRVPQVPRRTSTPTLRRKNALLGHVRDCTLAARRPFARRRSHDAQLLGLPVSRFGVRCRLRAVLVRPRVDTPRSDQRRWAG